MPTEPSQVTVPSASDALLAAFPLLETAQRDALAMLLTPRQVAEGTDLFSAGDAADGLYILAEGMVAVKKHTGFGRASQVIALLTPFAVVGEIGLIAAATRQATITAVQTSHLYQLAAADFAGFIQEHPAAGTQILQHLLKTVSVRLERCSARLAHIL